MHGHVQNAPLKRERPDSCYRKRRELGQKTRVIEIMKMTTPPSPSVTFVLTDPRSETPRGSCSQFIHEPFDSSTKEVDDISDASRDASRSRGSEKARSEAAIAASESVSSSSSSSSASDDEITRLKAQLALKSATRRPFVSQLPNTENTLRAPARKQSRDGVHFVSPYPSPAALAVERDDYFGFE